ncbi:MAG: squalene synthase HpnC [Planctomycetota bacterium]
MSTPSIDAARLSREHYENFPVASFLLPAAYRPHVQRIYAFARVADDLADEARDLAALGEWRVMLERALQGGAGDGLPDLLVDLAATARDFELPPSLLFDLLDAFERDLLQSRYRDLEDLLSYCRQSANPIGRLLLHLWDRADETSLELSDRICSALQILNHCQDVKADYLERRRVYLPQDRMLAHGVRDEDLAKDRCSPGLRHVIAELADFCGEEFEQCWPLTSRLGGRLGLELRGILHGACLVLKRLRRVEFEVFERRPRIRRTDGPELVLRSLFQSWPPRAARK